MAGIKLRPQLGQSHVFAVVGFMLVTLVMVTAMQLASGREPDASFGALPVFQLIIFEIIIALILQPLFGEAKVTGLVAARSLSLTLMFILFAANDVIELDEWIPAFEVQVDVAFGALWLAGGLLLMHQVTARSRNVLALGAVIAALVIQSGVAVFDLAAGAEITGSTSVVTETMESFVEGLVLLLYASGLLISIAVPAPAVNASVAGLGQRLAKAFFLAEYSSLGALAAISFTNAQFYFWRLFNRKGKFSDFYAWQITRKLDSGRAHRTLGARRFDVDNVFGNVAKHDAHSLQCRRPDHLIDRIIELGLERGDVLVDYGCGSLRVGQHLIAWLDAEKYWGLDVTDRFFNDGLNMLEPGCDDAKRPQLRVINEQSLDEVRSARPDFIISIAVLKHVPEYELDTYFDNLCGLAQETTTLAITFSESATEKRISGKSWSWSQHRIKKLIEERLPNHTIKVTLKGSLKQRNSLSLNGCFIVALPAA